MNSRPTPRRLRTNELGTAEGAASEATFRAGLTGKFAPALSHDPYNGVRPERNPQAKRTDLRELSRQIQLRRNQSD